MTTTTTEVQESKISTPLGGSRSSLTWSDLTSHQYFALLECARMKPGWYRWQPVTMQVLAGLGLVCRLENGTFAPTAAGMELLRVSRGARKREGIRRRQMVHG
jgi:hypothetical protein